jgi:peptidoglycan/LPS O-acetylase OafA/YrhL
MSADVEETTEKTVDPGEGCRRDARPPAHVDALDGLRALAILAVVAYHAWPGAVPGGFLGVTVFFVLTGFLTTRSVWAELRRTGRFRFRRYYTKRIVRIVPAVLATIGATVVLTPVLMASLLPKVHADALPAANDEGIRYEQDVAHSVLSHERLLLPGSITNESLRAWWLRCSRFLRASSRCMSCSTRR